MQDVDLSQKLRLAENDFLVSLGSGSTMLASYCQRWSALLDILNTGSRTGSIDNGTLCLAYSLSSRIAGLVSCFLHIKRGEEMYTTSFQSDCDAMLRQMAVLDLDEENRTHPCLYSSTSTPDLKSASPSFLTSAHRWLVDNLHDPYPPVKVKTQIAAASSCKLASVNSWFVNARRRIGWTTLCREHFSNCRADMIDAACRAFVNEDPQRPLSPELRHSFVTMKIAAEGLCSSTLTRSAFTGDLNSLVKSIIQEDRESIEIEECCQIEPLNLAKMARDSYPSPDRSVMVSPVPPLDNSLIEGSEEVSPSIRVGSKRGRSSIEPVSQPSSARRPTKRLRACSTSRAYLPSPSPSTGSIDLASADGSPDLSPVHSAQPETNKMIPSHKRRLSDTVDGTLKRSRDSMATPRLRVASDPLSCSNIESQYSINDWSTTNFDALFTIPPPVDAIMPDFSASYEVELFNDYSIPGFLQHAPRCPPAPLTDPQVSTSIDLSDFGSLLRPAGDDTFVPPAECVLPPIAAETSYTASLNSLIPDMSQIDTDWTSLFSSPDTHQPTNYSATPRRFADSQPLAEIGFSMLQSSPVVIPVKFQIDSAQNQAKLQQLHVMQEAVRRMEEELQAVGFTI